MDNNNIVYRKIAIECAVCKTKFEIWVDTANFNPKFEEHIRKNFHKYCPVCKALEAIEKDREK